MAANQISEDDPRLVFVPIDVAAIPPAGLIEHFKDRWWAVHPTKGLVFWKSSFREHHLAPQCNRNEEGTRMLFSKMYPWAEIQLIPSVFRSVRPADLVV